MNKPIPSFTWLQRVIQLIPIRFRIAGFLFLLALIGVSIWRLTESIPTSNPIETKLDQNQRLEQSRFVTQAKLEKVMVPERRKIRQNADQLTQITQSISNQAEYLKRIGQHIDGIQVDLKSLREWLGELEHARTKKAVQIAHVNQRRPKVRSRQKTVPFQLVTIDHWGDEPNAVIRANGRLYPLETGSGIHGWTVEKINAQTETVSLRHSSGRKMQLTSVGE